MLKPEACNSKSGRILLVGFAIGLSACGGSAKPAATENVEPASETKETAEAAEEPKQADRTPAEKTESSASEASGDDRKAILQLVLDDEELGKYLRVTEPGRFPLKVSGTDVPSGLTKATKPIEIVDSPAPKAAVLVITSVEITGKQASVAYRYDIEGIKGTTTLERGPRGWEILRSRIVEHYRADSK